MLQKQWYPATTLHGAAMQKTTNSAFKFYSWKVLKIFNSQQHNITRHIPSSHITNIYYYTIMLSYTVQNSNKLKHVTLELLF